MAHQHSSFTSPLPQALASVTDNLLPMKTFVHEVLKRSRTSGSILRAALCYLEAIREKVPEILQREKMGIRAHYYQPETKILPSTEAELAHEAELAALEDAQAFVVDSVEQLVSDDLRTIRLTDGENDHFDNMQHILEEDRASILSLVAEPSTPVDNSSVLSRSQKLPSALLFHRRASLTSLILAIKFFQDKCYSNRAWAKCCERALGQALEWRLWVGKSLLQAVSSLPTRTLCRSQSENVLSSSLQALPVLANKPVRKCATMSSNSFAEARSAKLGASVMQSRSSRSGHARLRKHPGEFQCDTLSCNVNVLMLLLSRTPPLSAPFHVQPPQFTEQITSTHTPGTQTSMAAMMAHQHSSFTSPLPQALASVADNLLPMKTLVHEVLKRSRTSGSILRAALCYLEAIREKVPEILQREKMGIRAHYYQPETKILPSTEAELAHEAELAALEDARPLLLIASSN